MSCNQLIIIIIIELNCLANHHHHVIAEFLPAELEAAPSAPRKLKRRSSLMAAVQMAVCTHRGEVTTLWAAGASPGRVDVGGGPQQ